MAPKPSQSDGAPSGSPGRPTPEQPRLGIIHLMGWTVCVAVYFSTTRAIFPAQVMERGGASLLFWLFQGVGSGAALGGLLLFVVRRFRGLPFPQQPGETLLVLLGVGALVQLIQYWLSSLLVTTGILRDSAWHYVLGGFQLLAAVLLGILYLIAIVRTKTLRWRLYFIVVVVAAVATVLVPLIVGFALGGRGMSGYRVILLYQFAPSLLRRAVLVAVALKDYSRRKEYRWTHWLAVGVDLWQGLVMAGCVTWWGLFAGL